MFGLGSEELIAIQEVIDKGVLSRYAPDRLGFCDKFEEQFAGYLNCKYAYLVNSGTSALACSLAAIGVRPGDEVIVPSYTYVSTASSVLQIGAKPVFAQIDSDLGICTKSVVKLISKKTKAVIAVHMDGRACNIFPLKKILRAKKIYLVEDCCQSLGASFRGKKLGAIGDISCFSFNYYKTLSCGEGGAFATNNLKLFNRAKQYSDSAFIFSKLGKKEKYGSNVLVGCSFRASEIQGAILIEQLKKIDQYLLELRKRRDYVFDKISTINGIEILKPINLEEDCGTTIYARLGREKHVGLMRGLMQSALDQPAHSFFSWGKFICDGIKNLNQKEKANISYPNYKKKLLPSEKILGTTFRITIRPGQSLEAFALYFKKIESLLKK